MVNAERFVKGMTFEQYVRLVATPDNLAREASRGPRKDFSGYLRTAYDATRLSPAHEAAWKWLVAQPEGPARVLAISEEWSSDCRRDIPVLAKVADTVGLDLRIFTRDRQNVRARPAAGAGLAQRRPDGAVPERAGRPDLPVDPGDRVLH